MSRTPWLVDSPLVKIQGDSLTSRGEEVERIAPEALPRNMASRLKSTRKQVLWVLALIMIVSGVPTSARASGGSLPPGVPQTNSPVPWRSIPCTANAGPHLCSIVAGKLEWTTTRLDRFYLEAIDQARAAEGLGPLFLPVDFASLGPRGQLYALVSAERTSRGLPPIYGTSLALTWAAQTGLNRSADPSLPTDLGESVAGWGSVWDDSSLVLRAWFMWMYEDGWGGSVISTPNLSCPGPGQPGCWGHRAVLLGDYGPRPVVGAAVGSMIEGAAQQTTTPGAALIIAPSSAAIGAVPLPSNAVEVTSDPTVLFPLTSPPMTGSLPVPAQVPTAPFTDLGAVPWASGAVSILHLTGVALGVGGDRFDPQADVTWAEAATMAGRLFQFPARPQDAPAGTPAWAVGSVGYAIDHGYMPPGASPVGVVNRGVFLSILAAASGAGSSSAGWFASGLLCGLSGGPDLSAPLTRAQAAVFFYRAELIAKPNDIGKAAVRISTLGRMTLYGPHGHVYTTSVASSCPVESPPKVDGSQSPA